MSLISLATIFVGSHDDAIRFIAHSNTFVSELLSKTWRDVRFLWDWDGRVVPVNGKERDLLNRCVHLLDQMPSMALTPPAPSLSSATYRLSRLVRLFYYLALAPHAPYRIQDLVTGPPDPPPELALAVGDALGSASGAARAAVLPQRRSAHARQAAHDLFMSAFGMLAFATMGASEGNPKTLPNGRTKVIADPSDESAMPSWAEPGSEERRTLIELGCERSLFVGGHREQRLILLAGTQSSLKRFSKTFRPTSSTRLKRASGLSTKAATKTRSKRSRSMTTSSRLPKRELMRCR